MDQSTIVELPLDQLYDSPFNPRKTFRAAEDLAESIKSAGRILQPLLVRPRVIHMLKDHSDPGSADGYEIVFGHRRRRAGELAGLATAPCMVRAMSDEEARRAQAIENLQREDLHAMEEAEGFQSIIELDNITPDQLAEQLGKSRSHVYGRLSLLKLCPSVRAACLAGEVLPTVALLLGRLRTEKLQEKALGYITKDYNAKLDDGGKRSFRHIRDLLNEKFTLELKGAIFDPEDTTLVDGAGACSACPKRTGNAPEFADIAAPSTKKNQHGYRVDEPPHEGPNVCTDPDCFAAKKAAHLKREADKLAAAGKTVVTGNKARAAVSAQGDVKGAYIALSDVKKLAEKTKAPAKKAAAKRPAPKYTHPATGDTWSGKGLQPAWVKAWLANGRRLAELETPAAEAPAAPTAKAEPPVVLIQDPRSGKLVKAVERKALAATGVRVPEANEARERELKKAAEESERRYALLLKVREAIAARPRDAFDLRMVAAAALAGVQWSDRKTIQRLWNVNDADQLKRRIDHMSPDELTALTMDCCLVDDVLVSYVGGTKPGPLLAAANHYGVKADAAPAQPKKAKRTPLKTSDDTAPDDAGLAEADAEAEAAA